MDHSRESVYYLWFTYHTLRITALSSLKGWATSLVEAVTILIGASGGSHALPNQMYGKKAL